MYTKGDIVSVNFPFSDLRSSKSRPALVLSGKKVNQTTDYILVQLTFKQWQDGLSVPIFTADYRGQPLPLPSEVRVHKIFMANHGLINRKLTRVTPKFRQKIVRKLVGLIQ
jgi:mRNA interferase MazF